MYNLGQNIKRDYYVIRIWEEGKVDWISFICVIEFKNPWFPFHWQNVGTNGLLSCVKRCPILLHIENVNKMQVIIGVEKGGVYFRRDKNIYIALMDLNYFN